MPYDTDRIIARIDKLCDLLNRRFDALEARFDRLCTRLEGMELDTGEIRTALESIRHSLDRMPGLWPTTLDLSETDDDDDRDVAGTVCRGVRH